MIIYESDRFKVEKLDYKEPVYIVYRIECEGMAFSTGSCPELNEDALREMWDEYRQLFDDGCRVDESEIIEP